MDRPQQQAAEGAAEDAAPHAGHQYLENDGPARALDGEMPEIVVIAQQGDGDQTRQDDGADHDAAGSCLQSAPQFLDGEDDAGQGRVEGGGDPRRSPGQDQVGGAQGAPVRQETLDSVQD